MTRRTALALLALVGCANEPPTVSLSAPDGAGPYYAELPVAVSGTVGDVDDEVADLQVVWSSSLDGVLSVSGPDASGVTGGDVDLTAGDHTLTLAVTDSAGNERTASVDLSVKAANTAPSCTIEAPADGASTNPGDALQIAISATDPDVGPERLSASISSSLDGALGDVELGADGSGTLQSTPSTGTHVLTLEVVDEVGGRCEATRVHSVGTPPTVAITEPVDGGIVDEGVPFDLVGTVSDDADAADSLVISWTSEVDGELSNASANGAGVVRSDATELSPGAQVITLRATDSQGLWAEASIDLTVNGMPAAPEVAIGPDPARTGDELSVELAAPSVDPDGDEVSYSYVWSRDGVEVGADPTVSPTLTARGETWTVRVTPNDGRLDGPAATSSATIANTQPEVAMLSLSSLTPRTDDSVAASAAGTDADGDAVSFSYAWTVGGAIVGETGASLSGSTYFDKGDEVQVEVTPNDGREDGPSATSPVATVENTPPTTPAVTADPEVALVGIDDILCDLTTASTDADDDAVTYTITWTADGRSYPSGFGSATGPDTTVLTDDTIPTADLDLADEWTCSLTASDGETTVGPVTATASVGSESKIGYYTEFSSSSVHGANYLLGTQVTVPSDTTVVRLGLIAKSTASNGKIALYSDSGGKPGALVVGSAGKAIVMGTNEFSVSSTTITAGTYWLMAVYDSTAYIGESSSTKTIYYKSMSYSASFPDPIGSISSYAGGYHNYYMVVVD